MRLRLIFLLLFSNFLLFGQSRDRTPLKGEPSKCYAKCIIPSRFEYREAAFPVYIGNYDNTIEYLEEVEIIFQAGGAEWVKRKSDENCISIDPNDCLVWTLVEFPEEIEVITVVTDTSKTKDYEWETFEFKELVEKGGYSEWREVLCKNKISATVNRQIQSALEDFGYNVGPITNAIGNKTKAALVQFQKDHGLPVGNLDIETLEALGVNY